MRPVRQNINAVGFTPWVMLSYPQPVFGVDLVAIPSSDFAGGNFAMQYTVDDQSTKRNVVVSQTASTTATVTDALHVMSVGDSVSIQGSNTKIDGQYQVVSITDANNYTILTTVNQTATSTSAVAIPARVLPVLNGAGTVSRTAAFLNAPVTAVRLALTTITAGSLDFLILQGFGS